MTEDLDRTQSPPLLNNAVVPIGVHPSQKLKRQRAIIETPNESVPEKKRQKTYKEFPGELFCGICSEIPVLPSMVSSTGHTCCKSCVEKWFFGKKNFTCPVTGTKIASPQIIPNQILKSFVFSFIEGTECDPDDQFYFWYRMAKANLSSGSFKIDKAKEYFDKANSIQCIGEIYKKFQKEANDFTKNVYNKLSEKRKMVKKMSHETTKNYMLFMRETIISAKACPEMALKNFINFPRDEDNKKIFYIVNDQEYCTLKCTEKGVQWDTSFMHFCGSTVTILEHKKPFYNVVSSVGNVSQKIIVPYNILVPID